MKLTTATLNKTSRNKAWLDQHVDCLRSVFPAYWTPIPIINTNKVRIISQLFAIGLPVADTSERAALKDIAWIMSELGYAGFIQRGHRKDDGRESFHINPQFGHTISISV